MVVVVVVVSVIVSNRRASSGYVIVCDCGHLLSSSFFAVCACRDRVFVCCCRGYAHCFQLTQLRLWRDFYVQDSHNRIRFVLFFNWLHNNFVSGVVQNT